MLPLFLNHLPVNEGYQIYTADAGGITQNQHTAPVLAPPNALTYQNHPYQVLLTISCLTATSEQNNPSTHYYQTILTDALPLAHFSDMQGVTDTLLLKNNIWRYSIPYFSPHRLTISAAVLAQLKKTSSSTKELKLDALKNLSSTFQSIEDPFFDLISKRNPTENDESFHSIAEYRCINNPKNYKGQNLYLIFHEGFNNQSNQGNARLSFYQGNYQKTGIESKSLIASLAFQTSTQVDDMFAILYRASPRDLCDDVSNVMMHSDVQGGVIGGEPGITAGIVGKQLFRLPTHNHFQEVMFETEDAQYRLHIQSLRQAPEIDQDN